MAIVAADAPESSSHTGKGALVAQPADAAPAWFSQYMNLDQMHKQTQMEKLHNMDQNSQLVLNKMEDMQVCPPRMAVNVFPHASRFCIMVCMRHAFNFDTTTYAAFAQRGCVRSASVPKAGSFPVQYTLHRLSLLFWAHACGM